MEDRTPVGRGAANSGELLVHVVDWNDDPTSLASLLPGARVERLANVSDVVEAATRSRPGLVVLRVPLEEVARSDVLGLLRAVAPACRVVLLPVGVISGPGDEGDAPAERGTSYGAPLGLSPAFRPDSKAVVRARALRPRAESAGLARHVVSSACTAAAAGELCFDSLIVGSELVTNAVTHARTAVGLTVRASAATVRIEVCDRGFGRPILRPAVLSSGGGRGLRIINAMCSAWGIDPSAKGKTVWAQLVAPKPAPNAI